MRFTQKTSEKLMELLELVKANPGGNAYTLLRQAGYPRKQCNKGWLYTKYLEELGEIVRKEGPDGKWILYAKGQEPPEKRVIVSPYQLLSVIKDLGNPTIRMICLEAFGVYNDTYSKAVSAMLGALTKAGRVYHKLEDGDMRWYLTEEFPPLYQSKPKPVIVEVPDVEEVRDLPYEDDPVRSDLSVQITEAIEGVLKANPRKLDDEQMIELQLIKQDLWKAIETINKLAGE